MKKAIMYVNQFFGQIGGEDKADFKPVIRAEQVGPVQPMAAQLHGEITHTVICGDNFMGSNTEEALAFIIGELEKLEFDLFIAGPAFQAGRYGVACGSVCRAVSRRFGVPVVTSMHVENPGVEMFKKDMYIMKGGNSAVKMRGNLADMARLCNKLLDGEPLLGAEAERYFARGIRHQAWTEGNSTAADRAVDMLLKRVRGEAFVTELPIPKLDRVPIATAIHDLSKAKVALVTSGGIVPVENPDKIQSASATRWGRYDISSMDRLESGVFKTIHAGYDPAAADADPNVVVPLDALREYEKEGRIGKLDDHFYTTVGTGTTQGEAQRMAREMVECLKKDGVDAVILTST